MRTSHIWWLAVPLAALGLVMQGLGDTSAERPWQDPVGVLGMFLVILPLTPALHVTMQRRRKASGESSPDSVEFQAALTARAGAYAEGVLLALGLFFVLTILTDGTAALFAMAFATLAAGAFWIRYRLALKDLRG